MNDWNDNAIKIFGDAATIKDPKEREVFVDEACAGNVKLRKHVDSLIAANVRADGFLEVPATDIYAKSMAHSNDVIGTTIDKYKILQEIGEGGFGIVYMAQQQEPVRRKVALKVIKPGMDTREVIARFEAERQALALMEHPNISKVFDAGTTSSGRPFFVMELVKGVEITEYCDEYRLSTQARLELFASVCNAVQHAHQKGVIHRDLKPSNVLVTEMGGEPIVKVIDFGVAKAVNRELTEKTLFTAYGQMIGTPQYMSPEQTATSAIDVDTRSDVYSLGVMLYELLTGSTPLDAKTLRTAGYGEIQRLVREFEPQTPSARLSDMGEGLKSVAAARRSDPILLGKVVKGELDWIVMRAIEKDRDRRYDSALSLARDLQRHLRGEAVEASPNSTAYVVQKFMKRNRLSITVATAILLTAFVGLVGTIVGFVRAAQTETHNASLASINDELERAKDDLDRIMYFRDVSGALTAWYANETGPTKRLLDQCPKPQRHWEWHYTNNLFEAGVRTLKDHENWVSSAAFSPDGMKLISGSRDTTVKLWDLVTGQAETLARHNSKDVTVNVCYGPYGKLIANTTAGDSVHIRNAQSGELVRTLTTNDGRISHLDFHPSGQSIVGSGTALVFWDLNTGDMLRSPLIRSPFDNAVVFSPDGSLFVTGSDGGDVTVWETESGNDLHTLAHGGPIRDVVFDKSGTRIATACDDHVARIWNVSTGLQVQQFAGHDLGVTSVDFDVTDTYVVTASYDHTVRIWDALSGAELNAFKGHDDVPWSVRFSPDGSQVVSSSRDHTIKIWDVEFHQEATVLKKHVGGVTCVSFDRSGSSLLSAGKDGALCVWNVETGLPVRSLVGHQSSIKDAEFGPLGHQIASGDAEGSIRLWNAATGESLLTLDGHEGGVSSLAFSRNGQHIVSVGRDEQAVIWEVATGKKLRTLPDPGASGKKVAFSPDGQFFATSGGWNTEVRVRRFPSCDVVHLLNGHEYYVENLAFSPDGLSLATAARDLSIKFWDLRTGKETSSIQGAGWFRFLTFSPDGKRIATPKGRLGEIKIWDAELAHEALTLRGHNAEILSLNFSPDGRRLASASEDGTVRIWDAGPDFVQETAR